MICLTVEMISHHVSQNDDIWLKNSRFSALKKFRFVRYLDENEKKKAYYMNDNQSQHWYVLNVLKCLKCENVFRCCNQNNKIIKEQNK